MDYGDSYATSYGAQGGMNGGGFMPGEQSDSPGGKKAYGKDTLRPVTIKQLLEAHHPHPDAEYFNIDGSEATQITFVGQIRNISKQATNVTYKIDDGTGIIEVKVWISDNSNQDGDDLTGRDKGLTEGGYARVWGRLKQFNNKRHVGGNIVRAVADFNEVGYHLLEATAVHLHFTRGPPGEQSNGAGAQHQQSNGYGADSHSADRQVPISASPSARKVYEYIRNAPQINEGVNVFEIANGTKMGIAEVEKAGEELSSNGLIYSTVDEHTWALLNI